MSGVPFDEMDEYAQMRHTIAEQRETIRKLSEQNMLDGLAGLRARMAAEKRGKVAQLEMSDEDFGRACMDCEALRVRVFSLANRYMASDLTVVDNKIASAALVTRFFALERLAILRRKAA